MFNCAGWDMGLKGYSPMLLSLYVMPTICEPLMIQPIATCTEQYPHLGSGVG